jgi:hypothetical protein
LFFFCAQELEAIARKNGITIKEFDLNDEESSEVVSEENQLIEIEVRYRCL